MQPFDPAPGAPPPRRPSPGFTAEDPGLPVFGAVQPARDAPRPERWRWITPLILLNAGIVGVAVFAGLTLKKSRDELSGLESRLEAVSQLEDERDRALATARDEETRAERLAARLEVVEKTAREAVKEAERTNEKAEDLETRLRKMTNKDEGEVEREGDRVTLKLVDKVLFRSGESELTKQGKRYLRKLGAELKRAKDKQIWVGGHTDDVPIGRRHPRFATNWELSSARALTVVHFFQDVVKIPGERLAAVGFSEYRPVSRKNKAKNRRIEIVLFPTGLELVAE
jgi:chemotaxis protein MotB